MTPPTAGTRRGGGAKAAATVYPDAVALLQLKAALVNGAEALNTWTCDTDDPCGLNGNPQWLGVTCNNAGRVTEV